MLVIFQMALMPNEFKEADMGDKLGARGCILMFS